MIAIRAKRVSENTAQEINERIRRQTEADIARYARAGNVAISQRLLELDAEWDIERYVETMAPVFTLAGLCLGATVNRRWLLLSAVVQGFFLQHALQGWCPPIPALRRMGVRTVEEISQERMALKALRGDFQNVVQESPDSCGSVRRALAAVSR